MTDTSGASGTQYPADLTLPNIRPLSAPAKPKVAVAYVDADDKPCDLAHAYGIRITAPGGDLTYGLEGPNGRERMLAIFGMWTLATQTAKRANAPIAEVEARFAKVTDTAWGDEKPARVPKAKRVPLTKEQKLDLEVDALLDVVAACKQAQGKPIQDLAAARQKILLGDPARGISPEKFRRDLKRDPSVAAEILRRKTVTVGVPADPSPDALAAL